MIRRTALIALAISPALLAQTPQPRMGDPLEGLTTAERAAFFDGRAAFGTGFLTRPGFGPGFNSTSCSACHNDPVVGGSAIDGVVRFGRLNDDGTYSDLLELGGPVLQNQGLPGENCADIFPFDDANAFSVRRTPALFGLGLVEAVDDQVFLDLAKAQTGIVSGRANLGFAIEDGVDGELRVGRFGFKSAVPTLRHFTGDAFLNEMGMTNELFPVENAPSGDPSALLVCDSVPEPELAPGPGGFINRTTLYQRYLAPPPQTPRSGMTGEALFVQVGCAECHVPSLTTADDPTLESALRNRTFKPYSDFLLHDMGTAGEGLLEQGIAAGEEMRTTPLWGLRGRVATWHDGRSAGGSIEERVLTPVTGAIDQHNAPGSEAAPSAQAFRALSAADQMEVIRFLDSLGRVEFDINGDDRVNQIDLDSFEVCYTAFATYTPDDPCSVHDFDQDGDVDADDVVALVLALDIPQEDCNNNGVGDLNEIASGGDANGDFVLDACQGEFGCPGDCDNNGVVDFADLVCTLGIFGNTFAPTPANCNNDGQVDFSDLVCALANFGPCE